MLFRLTLLGALLAWPGLLQAGEPLRVSLYLAENGHLKNDALLAPEKLGLRLHEVFGFEHYALLKESEIDLNQRWAQWAIPRKDFYLRLEPLAPDADGVTLVNYEIYKDGFIVAKGRYEPSQDTPLFIRGPDFDTGSLVLVLQKG